MGDSGVTALLDRALALAAQGIPCFPARLDKSPACPRGFVDATTDPAEVRRLFALPGAALVAMPTGPASGISVVDIDPRHGGDAWPGLARLPLTQTRATGGGGLHYYFRHSPGLRCSAGRIAPGADIRAEGGYVIAWGDVVLDEPIAPWPAWLLAAATTPAREHTVSAPELAPPSAAAVLDLLDRLPNEASTSRDTYVEVLLGAKGCIDGLDDPEAGQAIADAACRWAARWPGSPGYDAEAAKWAGDWSQRDAPLAGWPTLHRRGLRSIAGYAHEYAVAEFATVPLPPERPRAAGRFVFPSDCENGPRRGYIVKGILAPGDVAALIGPPGCGKSILAPHIAYAVAQGRAVLGMRTKPGRVLYIPSEDFTGMRQRVAALRRTYGDTRDFAMVDCGNLRDPAARATLRADVGEWRPDLVILDTLGAAFAGLDENSAQDMGEVVAMARDLARTGCAVLLVHHTTKANDGTPRGHSVLNGTLDMSLCLEPADEGGVIRGTLGKNRNGTTARQIAFRFHAVELGEDEDGDPITAPMAVELQPGDGARPDRLPRAPRAMLDILREKAGAGRMLESEWRAACVDGRRVSTADDRDGRTKAYRRAFAVLLDRRMVESSGGEVWAATGAATEFSDPGHFGQGPDMPVLSVRAIRGGQPGHSGHAPLGVSGCPTALEAPDLNLESLIAEARQSALANPEVAQP